MNHAKTTGARREVRLSRRSFMIAAPAIAFGVGAVLIGARPSAAAGNLIKVVKSPYCGCCSKWVDYLERAGWRSAVENVDDVAPYRRMMGVPDELAGCHTAFVDGYVVEGHVPLPAIEELLAERPNLAGIAAPGMPSGSPGMGGGGVVDVVGFRDGKSAGLFMRAQG